MFVTGIAQCSELCWQLRGLAEKRQVPNAKLALQHNIGLGGAVIVGLYRLGFPHYARFVLKVISFIFREELVEISFVWVIRNGQGLKITGNFEGNPDHVKQKIYTV